ncbi:MULTISPECIES: MaoC family dehydratase [unclassified Amycolatopsis]|uniref:MaoC family dehydratase n=1 Tax=unclassified Amycolatopsis TaxID=2618356 RepID=UPI001EE7B309|nr:MaoC family dehydratase [Amycolatopsis sp. Poz14]MCG3753906.1 MaoC family dehydratase [Amycolatopsis sp. Poz14]
MTREFSSLDDVRAALGTPLGPTPWLTVQQPRIDAFAEATGDHQWIHVDPERAAAGPYGATIAHGYLTLSLIPQFGPQLFRFGFGSARLNYGLNKVRFPAAVASGGRVRATAEFLDLRETGTGAQLTTRYTLELNGTDKPACVAEALTLLLP